MLAQVFRAAWLLVGVIALAFAPGCQNYDQLVEKDQICEQKWADYEAQLQRRYDLVPNLVNTVKASAKHEADTLTKVTEARASATRHQAHGRRLHRSGQDGGVPEGPRSA